MTQPSPETVEACLDRIRLAWNAADARAFAGEFADDATYVIFLGEALLGREAIERTHVDVLGRWQKGTKMVIKPISVRRLGDDVAVALTIGGLGNGSDIPYDKLQSFTMVRLGDRWLCAAFQNTEMSRRAKRLYNGGGGGLAQAWRRWTERRVS